MTVLTDIPANDASDYQFPKGWNLECIAFDCTTLAYYVYLTNGEKKIEASHPISTNAIAHAIQIAKFYDQVESIQTPKVLQ